MTKLLNCPFCSSEKITILEGRTPYQKSWVVCHGCRVKSTDFRSKLDAITAWNTRAPVEVKPLVWEKIGHEPGQQEYTATTPFGSYVIGIGSTKGRRYVDFENDALLDGDGVIWFNYLKEAKAAAQADYEQRLLSTLVTAPPTASAIRAQAIEECAQVAIDERDKRGCSNQTDGLWTAITRIRDMSDTPKMTVAQALDQKYMIHRLGTLIHKIGKDMDYLRALTEKEPGDE